MSIVKVTIACFSLMILTACDPSNVDPEALEYHRANREAYLYQGL